MTPILSLYRQAFSNLQRNVWILSLTMFINRSGSMVLLFAPLYMVKELHFTMAQAGVIMSFYGFGSVMGSYAGGWLTDRKNYFDIMLMSLLTSGIILLFMVIVKSQYFLSLVIFLYAFASDSFRPANSSAIATYSTPENRARSVGLVRLAINLGFSVGPAIGGFVALHLGYQWLFVIDSLTSIGAAAILFVYLPRQKAEKNKSENAVLKDKSTSAYRDVKYLSFIFLVSLFGICFFQLFVSVPQYFSKICHYDEDTIGLLIALNGLLVVIAEMPLVAALEKKKNYFTMIVAGTLFLPLAFGVLMAGDGIMLYALAYTIFLTIAEMLAFPFMFNYVLSQPLKERQGQYSALYSISFGLSTIIAPSLGLWIAQKFGFHVMFYFIISLSLVTAIGFWLLGKKYRGLKQLR